MPLRLSGSSRCGTRGERSRPHTLPKRKGNQLKLYRNPNLPDEYKLFEYANGDERNVYFENTGRLEFHREAGSLDELEFDTTGQSIENIDGRIIYPGAFGHSCYDVTIPILSTATCESIRPRSSPIAHCNVAEAQRESRGEVLFSNSELHSSISPEALNNDARKDKQEIDFLKPMHCNYTAPDTSLTVNTQGTISSCSEADGTLCVNGHIKEGGLVRTAVVKNDFFHENLGVCVPREAISTEATRQDRNMKNDTQSNETKHGNASIVSPGINVFTAGQTGSICQPHMSEGDVFTYGDRDSDKNVLRASRGKTTTTVLVQTQDCQHVLEDEKGNLKVWPYTDFESDRRHPVTLHRGKRGIKLVVRKAGMSHAPANMTVIQTAQHSTEMPENRLVEKYQSSAVLPGDSGAGQLMHTHGESVQKVLFKDTNGNSLTEEEFSAILPKIAESISKMKDVNAEEILPGITQSVTKLQNGGNLVITTMTRKLDEEESEESEDTQEPAHPVLNVDDLENSKLYLVQDSKGDLFYVEDITNESEESAYFSSVDTSDGMCNGSSSPNFRGISKIHQVGRSSIQNSTAEEILSAMYDQDGVQEITENEEEWSERTYEYDRPRGRSLNPSQGYSKESFRSSYMVEEPDTLPRGKTVSQDRVESSYEMSGLLPWVYDGGISQCYSQATHGAEDVDSSSAVSAGPGGELTRTTERLTIEAEAEIYPLVPAPPPPVFLPPLAVQTDTQQYSLVKVDVAPKHQEPVTTSVTVPEKTPTKEVEDRPIYKTVAHIQTREKQPPVKSEMAEPKKYRIISSKATSTDREEQETRMSLDEVDYKFTSENVEYRMSPSVKTTQYYLRNSTDLESPKRYRSEKKLELNSSSDQKHKTEIRVNDVKDAVVEESNFYSYDEMKAQMEQTDSSMRVVRGSYLIKNNLEEVDETLDDNLNMFDGNFTLRKDNPLYQSDEDLYRRYEREKQELAQKQEHFQRNLNQDISFETVDRFTKTKTGKDIFL